MNPPQNTANSSIIDTSDALARLVDNLLGESRIG